MKLTKTERLILANQYKILIRLEKGNASHYERAVEALESGYESAMNDLFDMIFDGLPASECSFVIETMAMYDALQRSFDALANKGSLKASDVDFLGFDGNNETTHMAYARFVVEHEQRFTYLRPTGSDFNSHMPSLGRYHTMIREWKSLGGGYQLNEAQISQILKAR